MKKPTFRNITTIVGRPHHGFTLVEVLTVIAIISILMTAGAIGLGNLTAGKGTSSGIATCESLFEEARIIAVSKRCKARLLIDVDDPNTETYLRRVVVAHQKIESNGDVDENTWVLAGRGYTLPKGTFYSRQYSTLDPSGDIPEINLAGSEVPTAYSGNYASYEFNGEGICENPGASFIIAAGARAKGGEPRVTKGAERDFAGFVVWRNGRTSSFRSPDQMNIPANTTDF